MRVSFAIFNQTKFPIFLLFLISVTSLNLSIAAPISTKLQKITKFKNPLEIRQVSFTTYKNESFSNKDFNGKYNLLFFGYLSCPDICPATIIELGNVYDNLKKHKLDKNINFLFVSLDPYRDTKARLSMFAQYKDNFLTTMTGNINDIDNLILSLGGYYEYQDPDDKTGTYSIHHSAEIFLITPKGKLLQTYSPPYFSDDISNSLIKIMSENKK